MRHLHHSLRGTMCLEYAPFFRSRLAVYLSLLCNYIKTPEGHEGWPEALQFEDHRKLNSTFTPPPPAIYCARVFPTVVYGGGVVAFFVFVLEGCFFFLRTFCRLLLVTERAIHRTTVVHLAATFRQVVVLDFVSRDAP